MWQLELREKAFVPNAFQTILKEDFEHIDDLLKRLSDVSYTTGSEVFLIHQLQSLHEDEALHIGMSNIRQANMWVRKVKS